MSDSITLQSGDYTLVFDKEGESGAYIEINMPDAIESANLSDVKVVGNVMTAKASFHIFLSADVTVKVTDTSIVLGIEHSWLADGDHTFDLAPDQIASVREFMKSYT